MQLNWVKDDVAYTATTNLMLEASPPLVPYSQTSKVKTVGTFGEVIQYLYLAAFGISLLCTKLIGIEMISLIQLTFYSLIPVSIFNPAFNGLYKMVFVSGVNLPLKDLQQVPISSNYSNLNLNSNFLTNINIMLVPFAMCPLVSGVLYLGSKFSNSYKWRPRLKQYAMASLC